jgi:hypothetical protein
MARYGFKVNVRWPDTEQGREIAQTVSVIGVSKTATIRTAQDAVKHCMMVTGQDPDGQPVRLIHHRDTETGEYTSIIAAEPVRDEPFKVEDMPVVQSIADAPAPAPK